MKTIIIKDFNNSEKIPELSNHLLTTLASSYLAPSSLCYREITVEFVFNLGKSLVVHLNYVYKF